MAARSARSSVTSPASRTSIPVANELSLGRFLNHELASVPDIDLDFPRDIREKLIVAVTERYGNEHAALVASFATYRSRGAIRDVGKALGLPQAELERLSRLTDGWDASRIAEEVAGLPDAERKLVSKRWRAFQFLTAEIAGLPRHISQHPGGMVISTRPLIDLVPVQPAAMAGRQLCQWDKDSCADAGFLKIDLLGLGMLSAVEECVEKIAEIYGAPIDLSRIPLDDRAVFAEIQRADTVGTFQIESRAQMQSLLRTKPETIDDLTVQVALVRPGPIQGKAVHPYIEHRRRLREDPAFVYPVDHEALREPLRSTLGVVVFQDQVLDVAIALAGFTVGEAEGLRRAMSRKRSRAALESHRVRFIEGAVRNGVDEKVADLVYDKLVGFSGFGFPKSHAAAFGLLAYQSQWLRHHYPAEFLCSLLNAQPMGFYPPASLVRDAQRRGVEVLSPDVNLSEAWCSLTRDRRAGVVDRPHAPQAVRIGLAYVQSVGEDDAAALVAERAANGPYRDVGDLARRVPLSKDGLVALVEGGACDGLGARSAAISSGSSASRPDRPLSRERRARRSSSRSRSIPTAATPALRDLTRWERMAADYRLTGLSVGTHPLLLLRPHLPGGDAPKRRAAPLSARIDRGLCGSRDREAAALDGEWDRVHAARGRVRPGEPDRAEERVRAASGDRPERAAAPRARPLRAGGGEPEHPRHLDRDPGGARPPGRGARCRRRAPARAPLRASLTSTELEVPRDAICRTRSLPERRGSPPCTSATGSNPSRVYAAMAAALSARTLSAIVSIPSASRSRQRAAHAPRARPCPRSSGSVATLPSAATRHSGNGRAHPPRRRAVRPAGSRRSARSRASAAEPRAGIGTAVERLDLGQVGRAEELDGNRVPARRSWRASASFRCGSASSIAYAPRASSSSGASRGRRAREEARRVNGAQQILHRIVGSSAIASSTGTAGSV